MTKRDIVLGRRELMGGAAGIGIAAAISAPQIATAAAMQTVAPPSTKEFLSAKKKVRVRGLDMAYYEVGHGRPIVFIHGNPTSSYQWRKIIPYVQNLGRCIAPDMIGMGNSDALPNSGPGVYTYQTQRDYMFELLDKLHVTDDVIFVIHDWGSTMGFEWAYHHPDKVRGLAYYEALMGPVTTQPEPTEGPFVTYRSPAGEKAVIEGNLFMNVVLQELAYYLSDEELAEYTRRYVKPGENRRPTLEWPREIPWGGNPKRVADVIDAYSPWLARDTRIPKLFFSSKPGAIFAYEPCLRFAQSLKNQKEVNIWGRHHLQDVAGDAMGRALAEWIQTLA